jgi:hypothetical protein
MLKGDGYKHPLEHYTYFTSDGVQIFTDDNESFSSADASLKLGSRLNH